MKTNKEITKIVREHYSFLSRYNDKRKNHRRIKFMHNGFDHGNSIYKRIENGITRSLRKASIDYISCEFESCSSYRGTYQALIIKLPI